MNAKARPAAATAYIGFGSNLGDTLGNIDRGIEALLAGGGVAVTARSPLYRTEPVGFADQDWFVNGAARIETALSPDALLQRLKEIEAAAGRRPGGVRNGPRELDLDILLYGDASFSRPDLTVPHPRMHERRFVLKPLCDIDPHIMHPVFRQSVGDLLAALDPDGPEVALL